MLNSTLEEEFVEVKHKSHNQSYNHIKTVKTGHTSIKATLIGVEFQVCSLIVSFSLFVYFMIFHSFLFANLI